LHTWQRLFRYMQLQVGADLVAHLERSTLCFMLPDVACWMMFTNLQGTRGSQTLHSTSAINVTRSDRLTS
jgi:hypothetical protein